ncbi:MAG TPA: phosphoribosylanthranilate isomerase [Acidimicrobiia bacterium]|nr:phosphoribosylanthranilate isomerase [Acidimicrobiia bacterium]
MTWVKICGLTRPEDVAAVERAGADALGFVLIASSPRAITIDQAADLIGGTETPTFILTKDLPPPELVAAVLATGATGVQPYGLHAAEAAAAATEVGLQVLRPVDPGEDLAEIPLDQYPLFDTKSKGGDGNGGRMVDTANLPRGDRAFVLAGGLTPRNVAEVIATTRPWGVDVSSGVETRPGLKDAALIRSFVDAVRKS